MKNIIAALMMLVGTSAAHAQNSFTYYMMTNNNSPSMKVTEPFVGKLKEHYSVDWKPNVGCAAKTQVEKETNPVFVELVTGQYWMSLYEGNTNCVIDLEKIRWIMVFDTAYKVCVRADSNINTFDDLLKNKEAKIAYGTGTVNKLLIESFNKEFNTNFKPVLLRTSNDILTAMLSKDLDIGVLNVLSADPQIASGNIKCIATTEKNKDTSISKLSPKTNNLVSTFALSYAVGVKNVNEEQFKNIEKVLKNVLETATLPQNITLVSLKDTAEKDLRNKVYDATINLYAATK